MEWGGRQGGLGVVTAEREGSMESSKCEPNCMEGLYRHREADAARESPVCMHAS